MRKAYIESFIILLFLSCCPFIVSSCHEEEKEEISDSPFDEEDIQHAQNQPCNGDGIRYIHVFHNGKHFLDGFSHNYPFTARRSPKWTMHSLPACVWHKRSSSAWMASFSNSPKIIEPPGAK